MSDAPGTPPIAISVDRTVNARDLSRHTGSLLSEVAFDGRSFAIRSHGRVIGFLVPREGREPVKRRGKIVYEVPEPEPLLELNPTQIEIVRVLYANGETVADLLVPKGGTAGKTLVALGHLEVKGLVRKSWMGYTLTPAGARHAEELGL